MSDLVDHGIIDRLRSGDCCVENNEDAAEHIGVLGDRIEKLEALLGRWTQHNMLSDDYAARLRRDTREALQEVDDAL